MTCVFCVINTQHYQSMYLIERRVIVCKQAERRYNFVTGICMQSHVRCFRFIVCIFVSIHTYMYNIHAMYDFINYKINRMNECTICHDAMYAVRTRVGTLTVVSLKYKELPPNITATK